MHLATERKSYRKPKKLASPRFPEFPDVPFDSADPFVVSDFLTVSAYVPWKITTNSLTPASEVLKAALYVTTLASKSKDFNSCGPWIFRLEKLVISKGFSETSSWQNDGYYLLLWHAT